MNLGTMPEMDARAYRRTKLAKCAVVLSALSKDSICNGSTSLPGVPPSGVTVTRPIPIPPTTASAAALPSERAKPLTWWPAAINSRTMADPTQPVAPVTNTFIG